MIADFFFLLFAALAASGAIMVVASRNPVASLLYLVLTLFSVAGTFVLLDAHFLAAVQVIVYAGAIMVLFLFVIMLLNLGSDDGTDLRGIFGRGLALLLGAATFATIATAVRSSAGGESAGRALASASREQNAVAVIADPLFREYVVPFEITSLLLLVAVVGAVALSRRQAP